MTGNAKEETDILFALSLCSALSLSLSPCRYFEHRWHTRKVFEENELLAQLPRGLSGDIKMFRSEYLLNRVPIFKLCHPAIVRTVVCNLKPMSCLADEVVYIAGQMAEEM